jgi:hypothetical protein
MALTGETEVLGEKPVATETVQNDKEKKTL